ncbi:DNA-dependent RNA polymerase subunit rpo132 [Carp edema virus]|nr:DNA-dependent RNA polymerase subunit rpo132 [Carp edema virus]
MEQKIGYLFIQPDPKDNVYYRPLHFQYQSYRNFLMYRLDEILSIDRELYSDKLNTEQYFMQIYDIEKTLPKFNPPIYALKGKGYDTSVKFNIKIYKKNYDNEKVTEKVLMNFTGADNSFINIPTLVNYGFSSIFGNGAPLYPNEIGGNFLNNKSIEKVGYNLLEKVTMWPKFKKLKNNQFSFSFSSQSPPNVLPPINRYFKLILDISNPGNFILSNQKTFISVHIIILIMYLTKGNLEFIKNALLSGIDTNNIFLIKIVENIIITTSELIEEYFSNTSSNINSVTEIINFLVTNEYKEQKSKLDLVTFKNNMFKTFLPHMAEDDDIKKGAFLIHLVKMFLFAIINPDEYPDRDSHIARRILTYGKYFEMVTIDELEEFIKRIKNALIINLDKKSLVPIPSNLFMVGFNTVYNNLLNGRFKKSEGHIKTMTHYSWMENLTSPRSVGFYPDQVKIAKIFNCRRFHQSQYGFFCPADIPDHGEHVGLVTQLSIHSSITDITTNVYLETEKMIIDLIKKFFKVDPKNIKSTFTLNKYLSGIPVMIENRVICYIARNKAKPLTEYLRKFKRAGYFKIKDFGVTLVPGFISQIRISIGSGRVVKPILLIENGKLVLDKYEEDIKNFEGTFSELQTQFPDVVEMIDIEQFQFSNICESRELFNQLPEDKKMLYDFCDFPAEFRNGYRSNCLLGINHNAGPRAIFGCAQVKQAISCLTSDIRNKIDNGIHILFPQHPCIVSTGIRTSKIASNTFGIHVKVALICAEGRNQEDAIVVKRSFIENAGFDILSAKKVQIEIPNENFKTTVPQNTINNYSKLSSFGIPKLNAILEKRDAYAKNISIRRIEDENISDKNYKNDISEPYTDIYPGRVERVYVESCDKVKVRILTLSERIPILGDKFTSRTSQKGTIAYIAEDDEIQFMADGSRPDFIINSTSIYGRKTMAMLIEMILTNLFSLNPLDENGKVRLINMPSSNETNLENYFEFVEKDIKRTNPDFSEDKIKGMTYCENVMYNPDTDEPYKKPLMVGYLYYLRLRHLTLDKATVRNRGRKTKLTKQPNEGRKKGGGIRFGEMERDCLIAHGSTITLAEILKDSEEDRNSIKICDNCSDILTLEKKEFFERYICIRCNSLKLTPTFTEVDIPHVIKVFKTQIGAQGVKINFKTDQSPSVYYKPIRKITRMINQD